MQETWLWSLGQEDPLEENSTHTSILAWRIPWEEEPSGLQSMGSQRVGHNWLTLTHHYLPTPPLHPGGCHLRESLSLSSGSLMLGKASCERALEGGPCEWIWDWIFSGFHMRKRKHGMRPFFSVALTESQAQLTPWLQPHQRPPS